MASEQLRKLAAELRNQAAQEEKARQVKTAQVLSAAQALALLEQKVGSTHG